MIQHHHMSSCLPADVWPAMRQDMFIIDSDGLWHHSWCHNPDVSVPPKWECPKVPK